MSRKSQVQAVREVFQFGLGLLVLSSIVYMFYNNFIPTVADYALTLEARNINSHVNYLIHQLLKITDNGVTSGEFELRYNMPNKLGDYSYTIYYSDNRVCTIINGLSIDECLNTDYKETIIEGVYLSGGQLIISAERLPSTTRVILSN